ncbi:hypothetical protein P4689_24800 [Priestia megaterium]|nr:hypothetical protein [Priestia megaterium]
MTGEVTPQNRKYANGVVLSPRGAEMLKDEIQLKLNIYA